VQLCNQVGHARPEEGSEHYFAYQAENLLGHGLPHGDLVGPGIMIMAELQGQPLEPLKAALQACHIPLDRIPSEVVRQVNQSLPDYARRHGLAYGIAHELDRYL
jgi:glycerol-1-phosphate dehydrogenase [NAD(P)+]